MTTSNQTSPSCDTCPPQVNAWFVEFNTLMPLVMTRIDPLLKQQPSSISLHQQSLVLAILFGDNVKEECDKNQDKLEQWQIPQTVKITAMRQFKGVDQLVLMKQFLQSFDP